MKDERITAERIVELSKNAMVMRGYLDYQGQANLEVFAGNPRTSTVGYAHYSYIQKGILKFEWQELASPVDQIEKIMGSWGGMSPEWFQNKPVALYERVSGGGVGHRLSIEPFHHQLLQHCFALYALLCNMHTSHLDRGRGAWDDMRYWLHSFIRDGNNVWKRAT